MSIHRFLTIIAALTVVGCAALPLNGKPASPQPRISSEQQSAPVPSARLAPHRDSLVVVQQYLSAVAERDIDAALSRVAYDVVLLETYPSPCAWQVLQGQQAIAGQLDYTNVLSFTVEDFQVNGNAISYTLTEWLDPRVVGPNFKQPLRRHMTAIVEHAEITNFILHHDSAGMTKESEIAPKTCNRS